MRGVSVEFSQGLLSSPSREEEMKVTKGVLWVLGIVMAGCVLLSGCYTARPLPPLESVMAKPVDQIGDEELAWFLEEARTGEFNEQKYWLPMMQRVLDAKRNGRLSPRIPRDEIRYFLKEYNQAKYRRYYDQAVFLWFRDIIKSPDKYPYRGADQAFLDAYVHACINQCGTPDCECLTVSRNISNALDREIFERYFGDQGPFK